MSFWKNILSEDNFSVSCSPLSFFRYLCGRSLGGQGKIESRSLKELSLKRQSLRKQLSIDGLNLDERALDGRSGHSSNPTESHPKQFCLWLVPAGSGSVKKLRFSARRALAVVSLVMVLTVGVVLLAGDYIRIQIVRVSEALSFADLEERHARLTAEADALFHRVAQLKSERDRLESAQAAVRSRVLELKAVLGEIRAVDLLTKRNGDNSDLVPPTGSLIGNSKKSLIASQSGAGTPGVGPGEMGGDHNTLAEQVGIGGEGTPLGDEEPQDGAIETEEGSQADVSDEGIGGVEFSIEESLRGSETLRGSEGEESALFGESRTSSWQQRDQGLTDSASDQAQVAFLAELDSFISRLKSFPIGYPGNGHINSDFGPRRSPFSHRYRLHQGVDLALPYGSPIFATAEGVVEKVKYHGSYGLVVEMRHKSGLVTRFAHLSKAHVKEGEEICRGEVVGLVGNSGMSTGPHLHYEVLLDSKPVDPTPFMKFPTSVDLSSLL